MIRENQIKSHIKLYWGIWLFLVFLLLGTRFIIYKESEIDFFTIYAVPTCIAVMVIGLLESRRLAKYLKINHNQKYKSLTYDPLFRTGLGNFKRKNIRAFLKSNDNLGDNNVSILIKDGKHFITVVPWWR